MSSTSESEEQKRNWLELPSDITFNILNRIGIVDKLENAQKVCTAWHKICKDPALWRVINMKDFLKNSNVGRVSIEKMCKHVVDRSHGQLVDIAIKNASNADELLLYVADRSSQLRRLEIYSGLATLCICISWNKVLMKFPLLEELCLSSMIISKEAIESAARYCPMLRTLRVIQYASSFWFHEDANDEIATAIGERLHELRHLQLDGNSMSNIGLQAILDGCPHLEILDLSRCFYIHPKGELGRRCAQQIKHVIWPCGIEKDPSEGDDYDNGFDYDYDDLLNDLGLDFGFYDDGDA